MIDPAERARDFASLADIAYLNTAAEGVPPPCVRDALLRYWDDKRRGGDGRAAHEAELARARAGAAALLGARPDDVAFCSTASEAYGLLATAIAARDGDEVVINDLDFPAGVTPWLAPGCAARPRLWRAREGRLAVDDLAALLTPRTRLVQASLVSFYNGHVLDWQTVRDLVRARAPQALLALDATQALGRLPFAAADADVVVASAHKWLLGAHGCALIAVAAGSAARVVTRAGGWHHLERPFAGDRFAAVARAKPGAAGFAVGMPPYAAVYALRAALDYLAAIGVERIAAHADPLVRALRAGLVDLGLEPMAPDDGVTAGIVAVQHPDGERLAAELRAAGVHAFHHVGRLRFAVHGYNVAADVERCLGALGAALAHAR